jgi:hypothetical protein
MGKFKHENKHKMRILTTVLSLCVIAVLVNCGTEDVGFNIGQVVPVGFPVELTGINDSKLPVQGLINPPAYSISEEFKLSDVTSDGSLVEEVVINGLAYKIEGVDDGEKFDMDQLRIQVLDGSTVILDLTVFTAGQPIANVSKLELSETQFNSGALTAALEAERTVDVITTADFAEIPDPIEFDFTFFFDVVAKVRQ